MLKWRRVHTLVAIAIVALAIVLGVVAANATVS